MWIATEHGYFSTVADRDEPAGTDLWVRARAVRDLERVRSAGYDTGPIIGHKTADYPYRVRMKRSEWGRYLADTAAGITYTNFKNRVAQVDAGRAKIYLEVWSALTDIEEDDWERDGVEFVNIVEQNR